MVENFLRILVCPLDWGIGHATRCVPIIRQLRQQNHEVILVADGRPLDFLREYFPDLEYVRLPGFKVAYPSGRNMIMKMIIQTPSLLFNIYKEHLALKKIIRECRADVVISDNRFGLWSAQVYSIYITHQLMIKAPGEMKWTENLLHFLHGWFIKHYDECWVPDLPGELNLSGDLGHKFPLPPNARYIGILSRFENHYRPTTDDQRPTTDDRRPTTDDRRPTTDNRRLTTEDRRLTTDDRRPTTDDRRPTTDDRRLTTDLLVLLSGPEPQRTILENMVLKELEQNPGLEVVLLQGLPGSEKKNSPYPGLTIFNHLPDAEMEQLISHAGMIICRPGYSTLMDLVTLGRSAVLVPTPGQTEQEYLAGYLSETGSFKSINQKDFKLEHAIKAGAEMPVNLFPVLPLEFLFLTSR